MREYRFKSCHLHHGTVAQLGVHWSCNMRCLNCNKTLKKGKLYCSNQCQNEFKYKKYIDDWFNGKVSGKRGENLVSKHIRKYLFRKNNNSCEKCGWCELNPYTGLFPLEIHHKDGDFNNNRPHNLELLCPNCHSLTKNFKSRNTSQRTR